MAFPLFSYPRNPHSWTVERNYFPSSPILIGYILLSTKAVAQHWIAANYMPLQTHHVACKEGNCLFEANSNLEKDLV